MPGQNGTHHKRLPYYQRLLSQKKDIVPIVVAHRDLVKKVLESNEFPNWGEKCLKLRFRYFESIGADWMILDGVNRSVACVAKGYKVPAFILRNEQNRQTLVAKMAKPGMQKSNPWFAGSVRCRPFEEGLKLLASHCSSTRAEYTVTLEEFFLRFMTGEEVSRSLRSTFYATSGVKRKGVKGKQVSAAIARMDVVNSMFGDGRDQQFAKLSERWRGDRYVIKAAVANKYQDDVMENALPADREDDEFMLEMLNLAEGVPAVDVFENASEAIRGDKKHALLACSKCGLCLNYVSNELKDDDEIAKAAVEEWGDAFQFASERLRGERWLLDLSFENRECEYGYWFASDELRRDFEVIKMWVEEIPRIIEAVPKDIPNFRDMAEYALLCALTPRHSEWMDWYLPHVWGVLSDSQKSYLSKWSDHPRVCRYITAKLRGDTEREARRFAR